MAKICIPIRETSQIKVISLINKYKTQCDLVEVWLDKIKNPDISKILKTTKNIVCVIKTKQEKGNYSGNEKNRIQMLIECCKKGAKYVDTSINTKVENTKLLMQNKEKTNIILSYHNFESTPSINTLKRVIGKMRKLKADVCKIAVYCKKPEDVMKLYILTNMLNKAKQKHIVLGMGEHGIQTRIFAPILQTTIVFAGYSKSKTSAPGQLTIKELKDAWKNIFV